LSVTSGQFDISPLASGNRCWCSWAARSVSAAVRETGLALEASQRRHGARHARGALGWIVPSAERQHRTKMPPLSK
jgi:hypothetical protein